MKKYSFKLSSSMGLFKQISNSSFFTRWTNWEFYPIYLVNIPVVFFWLWYAIRSRSLFFFSTVNPNIETGGVLGESKIDILNKLPQEYLPLSVFVDIENDNFISISSRVKSELGAFPLIVKPNIGERGLMVQKLENNAKLEQYHSNMKVDYIIQEFIAHPTEVSILYYRFPNVKKGVVSSFCIKKNLSVIGDGTRTIEELIRDDPRAKLQLQRLKRDKPLLMQQITNIDQEVLLDPIGNHSRGTTFLNGNNEIDDKLVLLFDSISHQVPDFLYGRYDIKCESIEALKDGRNFKILEYNGVASEPAHIYDPGFKWVEAYKVIFKHWNIIYRISKIQRENGVHAMTFKEAFKHIRNYRKLMKLMT